MEPLRSIKLRWLQSALGDVSYRVTTMHFLPSGPPTWQPAINAYRCADCLRICVELAGVDKSLIDLSVEPERLVLRGTREVPEPSGAQGRALQTIAMEIDYGPFEREIRFPAEVNVAEVTAEQREGLLWIILPLKKS